MFTHLIRDTLSKKQKLTHWGLRRNKHGGQGQTTDAGSKAPPKELLFEPLKILNTLQFFIRDLSMTDNKTHQLVDIFKTSYAKQIASCYFHKDKLKENGDNKFIFMLILFS